MESADLLRSSRIAALEGALSVLRLGDTTSRVTNIGGPIRNQVEHLRRLGDPEELVVTLVKAGLAKNILGRANVTSGAA